MDGSALRVCRHSAGLPKCRQFVFFAPYSRTNELDALFVQPPILRLRSRLAGVRGYVKFERSCSCPRVVSPSCRLRDWVPTFPFLSDVADTISLFFLPPNDSLISFRNQPPPAFPAFEPLCTVSMAGVSIPLAGLTKLTATWAQKNIAGGGRVITSVCSSLISISFLMARRLISFSSPRAARSSHNGRRPRLPCLLVRSKNFTLFS